MKKYIYLMLVNLLVFSGCNSTDEIYEELDKMDTGLVYDLEYTLTEDDYNLVGETFGSFSSPDDAAEMIPAILTQNFPQFGAGSSAMVEYALYNPIRINNEESFELTENDYVEIGENGSLNSEGDIIKAVEYKYPSPEANDVVTLTYLFTQSGETTERVSKVTFYENEWMISYRVTPADYTAMGQRFPNFDSRSTGRAKIAILFDQMFPFNEAGDIRSAIFTYTYVDDEDVRHFEDFLVVYQFDGTTWVPFEDVVSQVLQLGHDGSAWIPDNTIKYTLTGADYAAIAEATSESNPSGSASVAQYGNFDIGALWTKDQIIAAIGAHLLELFPSTEEGQKYLVTYATYDGAAGVGSVHLIFEGGAFKEFK